MRDSTGETKYSYNIDGSLKSVIYPDNKKISYDYDMQGAIIAINDILGNKTIYSYSKSNAKLESSEFISSITNEHQVEKYFYDKYGRIYYKLMPNNSKTIYEYNDLNGLKKLTHFVTDKQTLSYSFTYYKDLNIASRIRTGELGTNSIANETYKYDNLNNLLSYFCSGNLCPKDQNKNTIISEEYTFDGLNNISTAKAVFSDAQTSLTTYHYLNKDPIRLSGYSIISSKLNKNYTIDYDNEGNVIKDGDGNLFSYSPFNRMEKFISNGKETEYFYNGSGALVGQKTAISNEESRFYYNGSRVINEISNGNLISYFQVSGRIIGKKIDGKNFQLFLTDQAHSVIRILEGNTLLDIKLAYTPYGQSSDVSEKSNPLKLSNIGFNGERTDSKTGFQFLGQGYRAYNPGLGRFMQYDVNSPFGKGGINGYIFAENNPIMKFDSTGESAASYAVMGVGILLSIIGIVASVVSFGGTLSLTAVGGTLTTSATTTQIALATTSLVTGVASGATGIASAIYEHKAEMALEAGDKSAAENYANTASAFGWASLALGIVSAVSGIASSFNDIPKRYGKIGNRLNNEKLAYFLEHDNTDNYVPKIYRNQDIYDKVRDLQNIAGTPFRGKTFDAQSILYYMRAFTLGTDEEVGEYSAVAFFKASKIDQAKHIKSSGFQQSDPLYNKFMEIFDKSHTFDEYYDFYMEALTKVKNGIEL
jgi:RHS repeat-associated protein